MWIDFYSCRCTPLADGHILFHSSGLGLMIRNLPFFWLYLRLGQKYCLKHCRINLATFQLHSASPPLNQPAASDLLFQFRNKQAAFLCSTVYCKRELLGLPQMEECLLPKWRENK